MASDGFEVVAQSNRSKPVSVLIVEDEALVASYIEEVLGESGFRVAGIAASGPEALALAAEVGSSRVDLQACKLEYSIVSPK